MAHCFLLKRTFTARVLGLLLTALLISVAGHSQTIDYTGKNIPVEKLIGVIKQQTGYSVMYNPDVLNKANPVSVEAHEMPLKEFLDKILLGNVLTYTIENKTIFIKKGIDHSKMNHGDGGMIMMRIFQIHGKVADADGKPLSGVSVALDGSAYGIATDANGNFELPDVKKVSVITFSYLGHLKVTVPVLSCCTNAELPKGVASNMLDDNTTIILSVALTPEVKELDDISVLNNGFQIVTRERSTASAVKITNAELNTQINTSLTTALEGKAAGLSMYRGQPLIRGVSTFSANISTNPLLVIDGLPTEGDLSNINIYDVESVTVLKDAAAASIYGARAANGVLVITTKRAKRGETRVSASVDYIVNTKPDVDKMHYATTSQMIDYETDVYKYQLGKYSSAADFFASYGGVGSGSVKYYSPLYALYRNQAEGSVTDKQVDSTLGKWRNNDYIDDYTRLVWRNEITKRYNLSLNSGNDKSNTYFSLNYQDNQLRTLNNDNDNLNIYLKNSFTPQKWLNITVGANGGYTNSKATTGDYSDYTIQPRYASILDESGNKVYADYIKNGGLGSASMNSSLASYITGNSNFKSVKFNILDELNRGFTKTRALRLRAFGDISIKLPAGFAFTTKFQYELNKTDANTYNEAESYGMRMLYNQYTSYSNGVYTRNVPDGGRLYRYTKESRDYTFRNQLDYFKAFKIAGKTSDITALIGTEIRETYAPMYVASLLYGYNATTLANVEMDWKTLSTSGITSYLYGGTNTLSNTASSGLSDTRHRFFSMFGNFGYNFDSKYNLTGSIRIDQADLFGSDPKYRYRPLWSLGGAWNVSNEHFMDHISWVNSLKVRATYGVGGNVDQSTSSLVTAKVKSDNLYTNLTYFDLSTLPNPSLRWEKTTTVNLGVDFAVFKWLRGTIDYYRRRSSDLLTTSDLDPTVGASSQTINNGVILNNGLEVSLSSDWLKKKDLVLTSTFTIGYNKSKIDKTVRAVTDPYSLISAPTSYYLANTPFNAVYAYRFAGITNGIPSFYDEKGGQNVTFDATGNPTSMKQVTSVSALKQMGTLVPVYYGSFQQGIAYKAFRLNALFAFYGGHKLRKDVMSLDGYDQTDRALANRYSASNPNGMRVEIDYPSTYLTYVSSLSQYYRFSDVNVVSATSVRLRSVALSYALPGNYCRFLHIKDVRLTAQANNLWLWSAAGNDIDPETFGLNTGTRSLPTPKSYLFSAAITL